ncbi:MAG: zinc ribbon domain-containing protein [Desulfatiglandales bacterium]
MDGKLKVLLMIQSIDTRLDDIRREKEETPREIEKLGDDLDLLKKAMEQDLSSLEELKEGRRRVERELEEVEPRFKKSKARLNEVKSNKEYQAILKEIEDLKELISQKEEMVIGCMEEIEIQEKECATNNLRWEESQREFQNKEQDSSQRMRELDEELQSLSGRRGELSQQVDQDLLKRYNNLRIHLKGQVVVPVIEFVCQGCHLGIPPQQYNDLIRGDSLQSCHNCNRIIYWGGDEG